MMTLCNNFSISHLRIATYIILISIELSGSESVLLPDNCYSVPALAAVITLLYFQMEGSSTFHIGAETEIGSRHGH
jgi:hypothetical protein